MNQILQKKKENTPSFDKSKSTPLKEGNEDTNYLENKIDLMAYKLYKLSYKEVKIVDAEFDEVKDRVFKNFISSERFSM